MFVRARFLWCRLNWRRGWWKNVYPCKSAIGPPDPADELCSLNGRSTHRKQQQISNHCSLLTSTNPFLAPPPPRLQVKMIAIQNQSRRVTRASAWPFLYLQGNNMCWLWIKKSNDESDSYRCRWGTIDQPGSQNELGLADLHGSWQQGGHIQSHLTHSALTSDPWQCCPRVNCHLQGSIALDRRLGPQARALWTMEGIHRMVEAGGGGRGRLSEAADLKGQGCWPMMMWEISSEIGSDEGRGTSAHTRLCRFWMHQSASNLIPFKRKTETNIEVMTSKPRQKRKNFFSSSPNLFMSYMATSLHTSN